MSQLPAKKRIMDRDDDQWKLFRARYWIDSPYKCEKVHDEKGHSMTFFVMSYNILSQQALQTHRHLYQNCAPSHLVWKYRVANILDDLYFHRPEIICLQEIEEHDYENIFLVGLKKKGYDGVFKKKTGDKIDGCAIFYKIEKFTLIGAIPIEFRREEVPLLNRDNIALLCIFKPAAPGLSDKKLFVATTHLLFNPKRVDIRLSQLRILLAELEKHAVRSSDKNGHKAYHPMLVCGDFNFTPSSSLYDFLAFGEIVIPKNFSPIDALKVDQQTKYVDSASIGPSASSAAPIVSKAIPPKTLPRKDCCTADSDKEAVKLSHSLKLLSAYGDITSKDELMTATTYHSNVNDKVDYIFFNIEDIHYVEHEGKRIPQPKELGDLVPLKCFKLLKKQDLESMHALPNGCISSDHLYLIAKFKLI